MQSSAELAVKAKWPEAVCESAQGESFVYPDQVAGRISVGGFARRFHALGAGSTPEAAWEDARRRMEDK